MDKATFQQLMAKYDQAKSNPYGLDAETIKMVDLLESYQETFRTIFGMIRMEGILHLSNDLKHEFIDLKLLKEATVLITLAGRVEIETEVTRRRIEGFSLVPDPIIELSNALKKLADVIRPLATMFDNLKGCDREFEELLQAHQRPPVSCHTFRRTVESGVIDAVLRDAEFVAKAKPIFAKHHKILRKMKDDLEADKHPEILGRPPSPPIVDAAMAYLVERGYFPDLSRIESETPSSD